MEQMARRELDFENMLNQVAWCCHSIVQTATNDNSTCKSVMLAERITYFD